MKPIWVDARSPLPDPARESRDLVAMGQDLSPERLHEAYAKGLFPWFAPGDPVLWWCPEPRMVLTCTHLKIGRSLAKRVRQFDQPDGTFKVTLNTAFEPVIRHCAKRPSHRISLAQALHRPLPTPPQRPAQADSPSESWITADIIDAYSAWQRQGHVHSVEVWVDQTLVGGLYGVSLGRCFFGESMFSLATDASKVALVYLTRHLQHLGVPWIDCQQDTPHLARLGALPWPRQQFLAELARLSAAPMPSWRQGRMRANGLIDPTPQSPGPLP